MDYNILFIDEESTQHDQFMDYFEQVCPEIVPQCEFPLATVDEMLQRIEELSPDAVVTDFRLNEIRIDIHYNVKYNGIDLINAKSVLSFSYSCDNLVNAGFKINVAHKFIIDTGINNA